MFIVFFSSSNERTGEGTTTSISYLHLSKGAKSSLRDNYKMTRGKARISSLSILKISYMKKNKRLISTINIKEDVIHHILLATYLRPTLRNEGREGWDRFARARVYPGNVAEKILSSRYLVSSE